MSESERCFACDRPLAAIKNFVITEDLAQTVAVGHDCYRKIRKMDARGGYQPPLGGPRLFLIGSRG